LRDDLRYGKICKPITVKKCEYSVAFVAAELPRYVA
jgi:hypothetical protein